MRNEVGSWRDNWFAIHWLSALPLVRCAKEPTATKAFASFMKDTCMLAGGAVGMWFEMEYIPMKGLNSFEKTMAMTPGMLLGMFTGNLFFNTVSGTLCSKKPSEEHRPLVHSV